MGIDFHVNELTTGLAMTLSHKQACIAVSAIDLAVSVGIKTVIEDFDLFRMLLAFTSLTFSIGLARVS